MIDMYGNSIVKFIILYAKIIYLKKQSMAGNDGAHL